MTADGWPEDDGDYQAFMDAYEAGEWSRMPISYWLNPKHWPAEASCWLAQHNWRKYCHVHDVIHWGWTHRGCCGKQRRAGLEALRRAGLLG